MTNSKAKTTENQLQVADAAIVMPAISPKGFIEAWNEYQTLKKALMTKDDIQLIQGKEFPKKSYWRKVATAFNLSVEITSEEKETLDNGNIIYHFTQKATAPNGRFAFGTGSCDRMEKGRPNTIHNTRSTAETRAFNRAVSNLVGGGEVSAEEVVGESEEKPLTPRQMAEKKEEGEIVNPAEFICEVCGNGITERVDAYSRRQYNQALCMNCQAIRKGQQA